ncbi:MAG: glycosyltransferase family 39 protein [Isosphaeraceae bacterium]
MPSWAAVTGPWRASPRPGRCCSTPRHADAHLIGTDIPGMLIWAAAALAFWKGLYETDGRRWRIAVGFLVGLAFLEKMAALMVLLPLLGWLAAGHLLPALGSRRDWASWVDGLLSTALIAAPSVVAFAEIRRLSVLLPEPKVTNLLWIHLDTPIPGAILATPLVLWLVRRLLARLFPGSPLWGVERPALEIWLAILAFGPILAWLGNPSWWRETLPRLAHYYRLNVDRQGALPDIRIIYWGKTYLFSLPWHNGWVLLGIATPPAILLAGAAGAIYALARSRSDRLPLFFLVNALTWPVLRMLPTPAHDGIRLMLPSCFFLAGLAGLGVSRFSGKWGRIARDVLTCVLIFTSAYSLVTIHPFELSYYNAFVGGPAGAWRRGFELSYWYDAFDPVAIDALNRLPEGSLLGPPNEDERVPTFTELQALGRLSSHVRLEGEDPSGYPYEWLLTHDSKANGFSRLLFAMAPWYERRPRQLGGLRVASVADPAAVSRAYALTLLASAPGPKSAPVRAPLPDEIRSRFPIIARFWGEGLAEPTDRPGVYEPAFQWAVSDPNGLRSAANGLVAGVDGERPEVERLRSILTRNNQSGLVEGLRRLLADRPQAITEAVEILARHPEEVRSVLTRAGYTDPGWIGGYLDRDLTGIHH